MTKSKTMTRTAAALAIASSLGLAGLAGCSSEGTPEDTTLSDAEVLGALVTANQGEIQYSQMGADEAQDIEVKGFAAKLVLEHGVALAHVRGVANDANLPATDSGVSISLQEEEKNEEVDLQGAQNRGTDFDLRFLCGQIRLHKNLIETIDASLTPSAGDNRVRDEVAGMRPHVTDHLQEARDLTVKLAAGATVEATCQDRGGS